MNIENTKKQLILARRDVAEYEQIIKPLADELESEIAKLREQYARRNEELLAIWEQALSDTKTLDSQLRAMAILHYQSTGDKQPTEGVSVRCTVSYDYNEKYAIDWAVENAPIFVKRVIDKKAFEAYCKTNELPFVQGVETVTGVIAKDLK